MGTSTFQPSKSQFKWGNRFTITPVYGLIFSELLLGQQLRETRNCVGVHGMNGGQNGSALPGHEVSGFGEFIMTQNFLGNGFAIKALHGKSFAQLVFGIQTKNNSGRRYATLNGSSMNLGFGALIDARRDSFSTLGQAQYQCLRLPCLLHHKPPGRRRCAASERLRINNPAIVAQMPMGRRLQKLWKRWVAHLLSFRTQELGITLAEVPARAAVPVRLQ